uniref:Cyclin N-terminal domain-containing protein n=1 Tax=Acrobeloides nanus TaxID=290746 RepID=A0A914E646_9BILA
MNRTVFYKDVPTRKYFLRPRNASVMVNSEFRSDEEDILNPLVFTNHRVSGIGTKAQQESRNFHMKDNFKIWTENEKKGGSSQMSEDIFNFEKQHDMILAKESSNQNNGIKISTFGNCFGCKKNTNSEASLCQSSDANQSEDRQHFEDALTTVTKGQDMSHEGDSNSDVYTSDHIDPSTSSFSNQHAIHSYSPFVADIYKYLQFLEGKHCPRPNYMQKQSEIDSKMRATLIDWIADVVYDAKMDRSTFFLAVNLIDRMLSFLDCPKKKFQLVGATAVFTAAKFEEIYPPEVHEIVSFTDNSYTKTEVLRMEKIMLATLDYNISTPTVQTFALMLMDWQEMTSSAKNLAWYLLELSLLNYHMLLLRASDIAATAVFMAMYVVDEKPPMILEGVDINIMDLHEPASLLLESFHRASTDKLTALFAKYSDPKYNNVAELNLPNEVPPIFGK